MEPPPNMQSTRIFINPKFKKAYINPNFIAAPKQEKIDDEEMAQKVNNINPYINLNFIAASKQGKIDDEEMAQKVNNIHINPKFIQQCIIETTTLKNLEVKPFIQNTKRKLIRVPASPVNVPSKIQLAPFVKISKNKLIRSHLNPPIAAALSIGKVKRPALVKKTYKLINKFSSRTVGRSPKAKKFVTININGISYKATRNKLQKSNSSSNLAIGSKTPKAKDNAFTIRGIKFVVDGTGTKLHRVESKTKSKVRRIDIGGLTYVPKNDGTFIKTNSHETRSYLSNIKQKSMQMLMRNKMTKNNVPCPIYRRIGKCLSFSRGKCPKVHDPKHISICQLFLKGECIKENCLLSHNAGLEKMPVCKFFLQGCCVRVDCPYLHKKMSDHDEICLDFQKGFCLAADKCKKRHEFSFPEYKGKGKKTKYNDSKPITSPELLEVETKATERAPTTSRYYVDDSSNCENSVNSENQLKIIIGKVDDKMKETCANNSDVTLVVCDSDVKNDNELRGGLLKRPKIGDLPDYIPI